MPTTSTQNRLTFTGSSEPNCYITLYDGDQIVGFTIADSFGKWRAVTDKLADGLHAISATATNVAGTTSKHSPASYVEITASTGSQPKSEIATPIEVQLGYHTDSGSSSTDHVTNVNLPVYVGTAKPGSFVELVIDGVKGKYAAPVDANGNWQARGEVLGDGPHTISIIEHDKDGNTSAPSTAMAIVIDTTHPLKPTFAVTPLAGDAVGVSHTATPTFTGTAEAGVTVDLYGWDYFGTTKIGSAVADSDGHWSITASTVADGWHRFTVEATDLAGNATDSDWQGLTIDTNAPALLSTSDTGIAGDRVTNLARPSLYGKAAPGTSVVLYEGTEVIGTGVAGANGFWVVTSTKSLADGAHVLHAELTGRDGNALPATGVLVLTIDTQGPQTVSTKPVLDARDDHGSSSSDQITNTSTLTVRGVTEADSHAQIRVYVDGVEQYTKASVSQTGEWGSVLYGLSDGVHHISVTTTDQAGNMGAHSEEAIITVDTKAPDAPAAPALGSTANATPRLVGTAEAGAIVILYDGATRVGSAVADDRGAWSITSDKLADGLHSLTVTATDVAGNTSKASAALSVTIDSTLQPAAELKAPGALDLLASADSGASDTDNLTSAATPTIAGTAEAGATVLLFDGATQIGKAVANSSGAWSITSDKLLDGAHHLTAITQDAAGNQSAASAELLVTIDTGVSILSAPALDPLSDSGRSQSDGITNVTAPHLTGTTEAGATVTVYDNGMQVGTVVADDKGAWSINLKGLAVGPHSLTAKATDVAGNVSQASPALAITVDIKAPAAPTALDLPATADSGASNSDNLTNSAAPVITGKAEANATITLYEGETVLGTSIADSNGNWSITAATLADGLHNLTARAADAAGNLSAASSALKITIDTGSATPTALDLGAASDKGASNTDNITNLATPAISGKAEAGATITLYDGTAKIGTAVAGNNGAWSITTGKLADAEHHLTATATDATGNVSQASAELVVTVDTKAAVLAAAPLLDALSDSGRSQSDGVTSVTTPKISGVTEAGASVALYDGNTLLGSAVAGTDGNWSITAKALSNDIHKLTVKVTDIAGNLSAASPALTLTVDNKAPSAPTALDLAAASDSGASNSDKLTNSTAPVIAGKAEANAIVTLYEGSTVLGSATADSSGNWSITSAALASGAHNLTAKATDVAGNVSPASSALKITIDTAAADAPMALDMAATSDKGASSTDNITNLATPVISGKAEAGATVTLYDGVTKIGTAVAGNNGVWSIATGKLADAEHHLTATATDAAGNVSQASTELVVTIDTKTVAVAAAPLLDALSDSGRSQSDGVTNVATPKVGGVTEAGASVALYDGSTLVGTALAGDDGAWSITSKTLSAGAHKLTVKVTDAAGNVSAASPALTLTVDNRAPSAPTALDLLAIHDSGASNSDNKTAITTPTISGKAEANAIVALYDGDTLLGTALADNGGAWKITSSLSLATGAHRLTAKATDVAGNVSLASGALSLTIDPAATGLSLAGTSAADSFVLNSQAGAIKVGAFSAAGGDRLLLAHDYNGLSLDSAADVLALGHVDGKNFVIDLGAGHEVTLVGVTSLAESAILLV